MCWVQGVPLSRRVSDLSLRIDQGMAAIAPGEEGLAQGGDTRGRTGVATAPEGTRVQWRRGVKGAMARLLPCALQNCAPSSRQRHRHARTLTLAPSAALTPSHLSRALALRVNLVRPACNKSLNSWPPSETWRRPRQILSSSLHVCTEMGVNCWCVCLVGRVLCANL